jgi:hypothetical protein
MTYYLDEIRPTLFEPYVSEDIPPADHGAIHDIVEGDTNDHAIGAVGYIYNACIPRETKDKYPKRKLKTAIEYKAYEIYDNANGTNYTQRA